MAKFVRRHLFDSSRKLISAEEIVYEIEKKANYFCPCDTCCCVYRYHAPSGNRAAYFYQYGPVHDPSCTFAPREKSKKDSN